MIAREMQEDIATSMIDELCYNDRVDHVRNVDDGNLAPVNSRRQQFHIVNDNTQIVQGILDQANNGRDEEESESDDVGGDLIQQLETLDDAAAAIAEGFSDSLRQREDSDLFAPHTYLQFLNLLYFRRRLQHQHHSDLQRQVIARNEHDLGRASNTSTPAENMQVPFQLHPNRSATRYTHAQSGYSLQEVHIAVESATRDLTVSVEVMNGIYYQPKIY